MPRSLLVASLCLVTLPSLVVAQATGSIAGLVKDSTRGEPLHGARITVRTTEGRPAGSALSGRDGRYQVDGLADGTYSVSVSFIAFLPKRFDSVRVSGGSSTTIDAVLSLEAYHLSDIEVVSVSRVPEKITEAPASITVVPAVRVEERPALTILDHLKDVPGIMFSEGGLIQTNIVARGFNNVFSSTLLTLIDNRYAAVPSLRVNVPGFFPITDDDVERIEFVLGPGAALYGPNVAGGVLHIFTKSPLTSPGTTISLEGGLRSRSPSVLGTNASDDGGSLYRLGFRHASRLTPRLGVKLSGEFFGGDDWRYSDPGDTLSRGPNGGVVACRQTATGCRDFGLERWNGEARVDFKPNANTEWITSVGQSKAVNLIELTGIGAAQARDWAYRHVQTRFRHKEFFGQVFGNFSNAGETFLLRDGHPIVDKSRVLVAQAQHGFRLGSRETLIYGVDFVHTDARTEGTINGRNEDNDNTTEIGGYVHSVTTLSSKWELLAALRGDKHDRLESAVFSPRLGVVFKPSEEHNLRFTYNRAFVTPTNNDLFLDIPGGQAGPYTVRALGVPETGFHFRANGGCAGGLGNLCMRGIPIPGVPNVLVPANAVLLWDAAVGVMSQSPQLPSNLKQLLAAIPAPTTEVQSVLGRLNISTEQFVPIAPDQVRDIDPLKPTITNTLELGYKGNIAGKMRIALDGYYERRENFIGPLLVESPNVFLDPATLTAYLTAAFTPTLGADAAAQAAAAVAAGMSRIPLGVVLPNDSPLASQPDIFLTYRNFGSINIWGADLAADYLVNDRWSFALSYSWVNKDFFTAADVNGPTPVALNGSKSRGSAAIRFRNDRRGWATEARVRYVKGFPVNSGVYVSPQRSDGSFIPTDSYGIVDLNGSLRPSFRGRSMILALAINNVFNKSYATFVGVPKLGRSIITKLSVTF